MGGFASSVFGQAPGLSQAIAMPTPSLATGALLGQQAAARQTAAQQAAAVAAAPAAQTGSTVARGGPAGPGTASTPAQIAAQRTATPASPSAAQIGAYQGNAENALRSYYQEIGANLTRLNPSGALINNLPASAPQTPNALQQEGFNFLETYLPAETGARNYKAAFNGLNMSLPAGAPTVTAQEAALLGSGLSSAFPFGAGVGNTPGTNVFNTSQYGGNSNLATWTANTAPGSGANIPLWQSGNVIPGTMPDTFFPADEFGNVTGNPFSSLSPGGGANAFGGYTPPSPSVTNFGGDQPMAVGSQTPGWLNAMLASPRPYTPFFGPAPQFGQ